MKIKIIEMPLDFGGNRHGSDMGPSAIRLAGITESLEALGHKIEHCMPMRLQPQEYQVQGDPKAKYMAPIVKACSQLATEVEVAVRGDAYPLVLGGDHSIAMGTLAGISAAHADDGKRIGVLYVDAHADFNDCETSPSGNIHGMCMAASCGIGRDKLVSLYKPFRKIDPKKVCFVGLRSIDQGERKLMREAGVTAFTMSDVDRNGFASILKKVTKFFKENADVVHVSFDMDVIDPMFAPGVGIPLPGGLNYREALLLMEEMYSTGLVGSMEIVEVNPVLDVRNQTARMAVELIERLLGATIY